MLTPSAFPFTKMHGASNDFVVLDLRHMPPPSPALCRALADRHSGIGCDLILGIEPPRTPRAVASFRIWAADGSASPQCGNGARCIAAWVRREGLATSTRFELESPSGPLDVEVLADDLFRIAMGVPQFAPASIPLTGFGAAQDSYRIEIDGVASPAFAAVSIGNPHAVIEVPVIERAPICTLGPALQRACCFPRSVNVGFAEIVTPDRIKLRVYEVGAGETLACGSGACAAAAVFIRRGRVARDVTVMLQGGNILISWPGDNRPILMTGPAAFVFDGHFLLSRTLRGAIL